jgi:hypothetical protein
MTQGARLKIQDGNLYTKPFKKFEMLHYLVERVSLISFDSTKLTMIMMNVLSRMLILFSSVSNKSSRLVFFW